MRTARYITCSARIVQEDRSNHGTTIGIRYNGGSKAIRNNTGFVQRLLCTGHSHGHIINRIFCVSRIKVSSRMLQQDNTYILVSGTRSQTTCTPTPLTQTPSSDVVTLVTTNKVLLVTTNKVLLQTPQPTLSTPTAPSHRPMYSHMLNTHLFCKYTSA